MLRRSKLKPESKNEWRKLVKRADRHLQDYYRREPMACEVCGNLAYAMHHFIPKSQSAGLRFEDINLVAICASCHTRHHLGGDPLVHGTIMKNKGMRWYKKLEKIKLERKDWTLTREFLNKQFEIWS